MSLKATEVFVPAAYGVSKGSGVVMLKLLQSYEPSYTEVARKRKITAQAAVQFIVHENGQVRDAHLIKAIADAFTSPEDRAAAQTLYQKAIEAVYHDKFAPTTFHEQPVFSYVQCRD